MLTERFKYSRLRTPTCHHLEQPLFAGQQVLSAFPVIDIDLQVEPAQDATVRISQGQTENVEPAVDAIRSPMAALNVVWTAHFVSLPLRCDCVRKVIGMNGIGTLPGFQLVQCPAEVIQSCLIESFDLTLRRRDCDRRRNAVDDQAKINLAPSQRFLGAL